MLPWKLIVSRACIFIVGVEFAKEFAPIVNVLSFKAIGSPFTPLNISIVDVPIWPEEIFKCDFWSEKLISPV